MFSTTDYLTASESTLNFLLNKSLAANSNITVPSFMDLPANVPSTIGPSTTISSSIIPSTSFKKCEQKSPHFYCSTTQIKN